MTPSSFVKAVSDLRFDNAFNPYADTCHVFDIDRAPARRSETLCAILEAAECVDVDSVWIGRDLGHRGGRRTGLALTDDVHVSSHAHRWGLRTERSTKGAPVVERTAAIVWDQLNAINAPIFLWNVFPLHPHQSDEPFTNRSHNSREREAGIELLHQLLLLLRPNRLVAIGNDAADVARRVADSSSVWHLRHPSYGGQSIFRKQMAELYGSDIETQARLFG